MVVQRAHEKPFGGRAEREAARARVKKDIREKTESFIVERMPYLESESGDASAHEKAVPKVIRKIQQSFKVARDHQIAREYFEKRIERFNNENDKDLAVPIAPVRFRFNRLRRTATWCQHRRALNEAHEHLMLALNTNRTPRLSVEERLGLVLYFAVTCGGLCSPRALVAFRQALESGATIYADHTTQLIWFDFYYSSKGACNEIVDGKLRVCRRWFVPPACRLSLFGYLHNRADEDPSSSDVSEHVLIKRAFETLSGRAYPIKTLKRFCSVGIAIAERQQGVDLSELEISYATGAIECMSLRKDNWELALTEIHNRESDHV
jgi:hypothetical protein